MVECSTETKSDQVSSRKEKGASSERDSEQAPPLLEIRPGAKSISRKAVSAPARVKTAVVISAEAFRRLGACCISENMTQSEVVELLINRSLSGYVVSVRGSVSVPLSLWIGKTLTTR
jgi:hypothetical protein